MKSSGKKITFSKPEILYYTSKQLIIREHEIIVDLAETSICDIEFWYICGVYCVQDIGSIVLFGCEFGCWEIIALCVIMHIDQTQSTSIAVNQIHKHLKSIEHDSNECSKMTYNDRTLTMRMNFIGRSYNVRVLS